MSPGTAARAWDMTQTAPASQATRPQTEQRLMAAKAQTSSSRQPVWEMSMDAEPRPPKAISAATEAAAAQTAELARDARVKKLVITHLNPNIDPETLLKQARAIRTDAELAHIGATYRV